MIETQADKEKGDSQKKIGRVTSFNRKQSVIHIKQSGEEQRPHIHRAMSGENISDKVYDLMESYLPKDMPSIQKQ